MARKGKLPDVAVEDAQEIPAKLVAQGTEHPDDATSDPGASPDSTSTAGPVAKRQGGTKASGDGQKDTLDRGSHSRLPIFLAGGALVLSVVALALVVMMPSGNEPGPDNVDQPSQGLPSSEAMGLSKDIQRVTSSILILDLGRALLTAEPFHIEARAVRSVVSDDPDVLVLIDFLEPYANAGVPTRYDLAKQLQRLMVEIVPLPGEAEENSQNWSSQVLETAGSWVTSVWPGDTPDARRTNAVLTVAASHMDSGDLEQTLAALNELENTPYRGAAEELVERITDRIALNRASYALSELGLRKLTGTE